MIGRNRRIGKFADYIVLDQNLFDLDPADIDDTTILATVVAGTTGHRDPGFTP